MHKLLDEYLCKKYPKIFRDRNASMTVTCMCWGFPGDGWFFLIEGLCGSIQRHIDNHNEWVEEYGKELWEKEKRGELNDDISISEPKLIPQVVATQVKEKFGGLRFYYGGGDEQIEGMVSLAESLSYRICEECGVMTELVNPNAGGWIQTTCPMCAKNGEGHFKNRNLELASIWEEIRHEKLGHIKDALESLKNKKEQEGNLSTFDLMFGKTPEGEKDGK